MRVLVTGGTGYLGGAIVRAVAARGHTPVVFARHATAHVRAQRTATSGRDAAPADAIDGDIRDRDAVARAVRGCDAVCHAAALVSIWRRDPRDFDAVNVGGLQNILQAAHAAGTRRVVYTSSFLARPPAGRREPVRLNDYQRTKVIADGMARDAAASGAPIVTLYPGVVYGPGESTEGDLVGRLLRDQRGGRLPGLIGAERIWSFSWIDDVAAAHMAAVEHSSPADAYTLGGDNQPQIRLFELARASNGWTYPVPRSLPYWLASTAGLLEEGRARLTGRLPLVTRGAVAIFRHDWPLDCASAAEDLGYRPSALADRIGTVIRSLS